MALIRTAPPAVLPISLAEVKAITRLDGDEAGDAVIAGYLRAATEWVEARLGRALIASGWEYTLRHFPPCWDMPIRLPIAPLLSVTEIRYLDVAGVQQVLDPATYVVAGGDLGRISLAHGKSWPAVWWQDNAVTIAFQAGYGPYWDSVPEPIRSAIVEVVRGLFDGCAPSGAEELLELYRILQI